MATGRSILFKGGVVLAHAGDEATPRDLVIQDDRIVAVGANLDPAAFGAAEERSAAGMLIAPGFINTHHHSHDRWDRGRFSPLPLEIWMSLYNPPVVGRGWTPDEIYLRTVLGGMELLRGGSTAVIDDVHLGLQLDEKSIDAVFRAYRDLGLRADVGIAYADRPPHETIPYLAELLPEHLKSKGQTQALAPREMLDVWRALATRHDGRVRAVVSVSGPQRCTERFQGDAADLSEAIRRPLLTHVLESRVQAITGPHFFGKSLVAFMDGVGSLRANTVLIHGVWMSPDDLDHVARAGASISHNPVSNLKLGSGIAPLIAMRERGIPVGIGTDNHNANDGCSMFEAVKIAAMLQTTQTSDYRRWPDAAASLRAGGETGAQLMGLRSQLGRIEPGHKADFLLFDLSADAFLPLHDARVHLVFADAARALRGAYIDGREVLRGGVFVTVNEAEIRQEIGDRIAVMRKKVLNGVPKAQELEPYLVAAYEKCLNDPFSRAIADRCNCCLPPGAGLTHQ